MLPISVLLPVYNGEEWVGDAIASIKNQSYKNWELLILDDGSTDKSVSICKRAQKGFSNIQVYQNKKNRGLAATLNQLLKIAQYEYIAIQEQDDISLPHRLSIQVKLLAEKSKVGLVAGIAARIDDEMKIMSYTPDILVENKQFPQNREELILGLYTRKFDLPHSTIMFRKSFTQNIIGPFDEEAIVSIDRQFFVDYAHYSNIWGIPLPLVKIRRGVSHHSLTSDTDLVIREARRCINVLYQKYKTTPTSPINKYYYQKAIIAQENAEKMRLENRS